MFSNKRRAFIFFLGGISFFLFARSAQTMMSRRDSQKTAHLQSRAQKSKRDHQIIREGLQRDLLREAPVHSAGGHSPSVATQDAGRFSAMMEASKQARRDRAQVEFTNQVEERKLGQEAKKLSFSRNPFGDEEHRWTILRNSGFAQIEKDSASSASSNSAFSGYSFSSTSGLGSSGAFGFSEEGASGSQNRGGIRWIGDRSLNPDPNKGWNTRD